MCTQPMRHIPLGIQKLAPVEHNFTHRQQAWCPPVLRECWLRAMWDNGLSCTQAPDRKRAAGNGKSVCEQLSVQLRCDE